MNASIFSYKQPLFKPCEQDFPQFIELEPANVTIPISLSILDLLNNYNFSEGNNLTLQSLLDDMVKSPSYFFPDASLVFDRSNWLSSFVPDDNSYHKLNWSSLILQIHISLINKVGYSKIAETLKSRSRGPSFDFSHQQTIKSYRGSNMVYNQQDQKDPNVELLSEHQTPQFMKHDRSTGSFKLNQNRCIGSFNAAKKPSVGPAPESLQSLSVSPIQRENKRVTNDISKNISLEVHPFLNIQFNCSLESSFFKSIVLAVSAHGSLDAALGCLIAQEYSKELKEVDIQISELSDPSPVFANYYENITRCLLDQNIESTIIREAAEDDVSSALKKISSLMPFAFVPHSRMFVESIVAPLCYHENTMFADKAIEIYTTLLNGHNWDLHKTEVSTAETRLTFRAPEDTTLTENTLILLAVPMNESNNENKNEGNVYFTSLRINNHTAYYQPFTAGFYDYCYARITPNGEYEIDQSLPSGRYVVLPSGARKEIIHEMCAFDERETISFYTLAEQLKTLATSGVTAVHLIGAIERAALHRMTSVTDHSAINRKAGGMEGFREFCEKAKSLKIRICVDFTPLISIHNWSRKYAPFQVLKVDEEGVYKTAQITNTELMLLNMRSTQFWDLLTNELIDLCRKTGISGFYLGNVNDWDYVYPRDIRELLRVDPDGELHYYSKNIIEGSVVLESPKTSRCGISTHYTKCNPFLSKLMRKLWSVQPDAFVWMKAETSLQRFVIESGIIPQNNDLSKVMNTSIDHCLHTDDLSQITVMKNFKKFYKKRAEELPQNSLIISSYGSITDGPFKTEFEGISLAIDILVFLTDVPLISGCLDSAMSVPSAYDVNRPRRKARKWSPQSHKFQEYLSTKVASIRGTPEWILNGDCSILPVAYDSSPLEAVLAFARTDNRTNHCALICTSFYTKDLIFEVYAKDIPFFQDKNIEAETVIRMKPLLGSQTTETSFYGFKEVTQDGSSFFLDIERFSICVYEIDLIKPPIPPTISRILMENVYTRLQRAISFHSIPVLAHNLIFNSVSNLIEKKDISVNEIAQLVKSLPEDPELYLTFREALFFATRYIREKIKIKGKGNQLTLKKLSDDNEIEERENSVLNVLTLMKDDKTTNFISKFGKDVMEANKLGPIMFIAPELGPFSKVGGLSTMVWELAKELVALGLDIHVVSPYYNISPNGEQNEYLAKYGVEYKFKMDVYVPSKAEVGVYYGLIDGVKCWFLRHYSYFAAPYQTGSTSFRLQTLVLMGKAPLELCCQTSLIPSLFITNDWMTGLTAAYGRHSFGTVFNGSKFMHIFHNLGAGYAGKLWPNDGDTGSLHYIHQLPDQLIVDPFDHSFDPSLCALLASDQWATVSKKYRDELLEGSPYNYFLKNFPEPFAYSNGIRVNERRAELEQLHMNHKQAKEAIQKKYFGKADDSKCVFVFVGRIVEQKGVYLIVDTFEELNKKFNEKLQFIVGGQAAADDITYGLPCTQKMLDLKQRFPNNFWADPSKFFTDGLLCDLGADYMLIPSLFEPSGIVQQESFICGTPVIAFRTGGLADTVFEYDREKKTGNGLVFWSHRHDDFKMAMDRAYSLFLDKDEYAILRDNASKSVLSTEKVAREWAREFSRLFLKIYMPDQNNENYQPKIPESEIRRMKEEEEAKKIAAEAEKKAKEDAEERERLKAQKLAKKAESEEKSPKPETTKATPASESASPSNSASKPQSTTASKTTNKKDKS